MFDVEFLVPVCGRLKHRLADFKRYGLANSKNRSVKLTLIVSGELINDLDSGWPAGFSVNIVESKSSNFIGNLYRYYVDLDPSNLDFRWFVRLDDDSCTDVDGLLTNLDRFFDDSCPRYLGDLNAFHCARAGGELVAYNQYRSLLGPYDRFVDLMQNEVECGIMSASAVAKMIKNEASRQLLETRSDISGGFGDCVVAIAAAMSGVWPVNCPFVTKDPLIHEFSLLGGIRNHIHRVCRPESDGSPWGRPGSEAFTLLTKVVDASPNKVEASLVGKRLLIENSESVRLLEFLDGYKAKSKTEKNVLNWYEHAGQVLVLQECSVVERLKVHETGKISLEGSSITEL